MKGKRASGKRRRMRMDAWVLIRQDAWVLKRCRKRHRSIFVPNGSSNNTGNKSSRWQGEIRDICNISLRIHMRENNIPKCVNYIVLSYHPTRRGWKRSSDANIRDRRMKQGEPSSEELTLTHTHTHIFTHTRTVVPACGKKERRKNDKTRVRGKSKRTKTMDNNKLGQQPRQHQQQ